MKKTVLYVNGRIYTQAQSAPAESMAVRAGQIVAVGRNLKHDSDFASCRVVDLKGHTVVPGFTDAHAHFLYFAKTLHRVALDSCTSIAECLTEIGAWGNAHPKSTWIYGDGFLLDRMREKRLPTRAELDSVTGHRPAFIYFKDHHSAWVNSRALKLAGIGRTTPDPAGGKIERMADGEPLGILRELSAYGPVFEKIPPPSGSELHAAYDRARAVAYERGVTGIHSFDAPSALPFFVERDIAGSLGLRIVMYPLASALDSLREAGATYEARTDCFRIGGVKIFADGALGSRTALMFSPYAGTRNRGIEVTSVAEMKRLSRRAASLGFPCAIHAIGDKAVANVIDALEPVARLKNGARHRIEHVQCARKSDLKRMKQLGLVASVQPSHTVSDIEMARKHWGKRAANAYLFRTMLKLGIPVAFGSDLPIEPLDPIGGIAAAVRRARQGSRDIFFPEERISIRDALFAFTVGPARAAGEEDRRGYLLPGYPADFVLLSHDIFKAKVTELYHVRPVATFFAGVPVYSTSGFSL